MSAPASDLTLNGFLRPGQDTPASAATSCSSLEKLATRSALYLTLRYGLTLVTGLGNMLVLTWWIGPRAYGLFVTAVGITTFLSSLTRFGIDTYLVRCEAAPTNKHYNVAFTMVLGLSLALTAVGAGATPLLVRWFSDTEFVAPYLVLLLTVPLIGLAGPALAKLERALNFRTVSAIELGGQFTSLAVSFILAGCGLRVWAPVGGFVAWQIVALVAAFTATRFHVRLQFETASARSMLLYGFGFSASVRTFQLRTLVNPLLVARFAGPEGAAFVALAIRLAESLSFVRTAAGRLAIAGFARLQLDRSRLKYALEKSIYLQVVCLGPLLGLFTIAAPWLIPRFLGPRWSPAVAVFPLIATGVLVNSIFNLQASALFVLGHQWAVMRSYVLHVALLTGASLFLVPLLGISGYGWAEVLACLGYGLIASSLSGHVTLSYRKVLTATALFLAPLLLQAGQVRNPVILSVPLVIGLAIVANEYAPWLLHNGGSMEGLRAHGTLRRLLTVVAKTKTRKLAYVVGLLQYESHKACYQLRHKVRPTATASVQQTSKVFHFAPDDIDDIVRSVPDEVKRRAIAEADLVLQRRFCFRGRELVLNDAIDWHTCPGGSLSWQWDLNRQSFFPCLGTAYYYTRNPAFVSELKMLWEHWIQANPSNTANWKQPFEVAARLQNWMWAYFLLAYSEEASPCELQRFAASIGQQAEFLAAHLEYHWPNNHLLLEAKALYEFVLLFPEYDLAGKWHARAESLMEAQIASQVLMDGVHAELSSMYHRIVAGELLELAALCRRMGVPLAPELDARIARMSAFSRALSRPDGSVPLLGDSAATDTYIRFDPDQKLGSDLKFWIPAISQSAMSSPAPPLEIFPEAGYAFLRSRDGTVHLTFDCGPFSRCSSPNHGHCDALSFELYCKGMPVIIDPGIYFAWTDMARWARHFRSTGAHNTVQMDGREQSELSDICDVIRTSRGRMTNSAITANGVMVAGECTPYWSENGEIRHTRRITLQGNEQVCIHDEVVGSGMHRLQWTFQFAPEIDVHGTGAVTIEARTQADQPVLTLCAMSSPEMTLELFRGCDTPLRGWVSRNSAELLPATAAVFTVETPLPMLADFTVKILP